MDIRTQVGDVVGRVISGEAKTVTLVLAPKLAIRASERGKHYKKRRTQEILVTVGKPNYRTRLALSCKGHDVQLPMYLYEKKAW